jgi:hypothetical protein
MKTIMFVVEAKDYNFIVEAEDTKEAFAKFFADFIDSNCSLAEIGNIIKIKVNNDEVAFRTIPTLVLLGKLSVSDGIFNICNVLQIDMLKACQILQQCMIQDEWILDLVNKVDLGIA